MTSGPARSRLSADDRRRQLVEIGLELLTTRPIHAMALDEVAAQAGISRTLLFHYFPTKRDYYSAVVQAAGERMLSPVREPAGDSPAERVRSLVAGYLRLVARSREAYVPLVRGASGGDPRVLAILDELRASLVPRWLDAAEWPDRSRLTVLLVRGWLASLEEIALVRTPDDPGLGVLTERLAASFFAQLTVAADARVAPTTAGSAPTVVEG